MTERQPKESGDVRNMRSHRQLAEDDRTPTHESMPRRANNQNSATGIPKDWAHLSSIGSVILGTRFICFKTPFDHLRQYPKDVTVFTSTHLLQQLGEKGVPLGMVVDLTDSERYYTPHALQQMGLFHLKIRIPGRAIPLDSHYERFRNEVDKFLADPAARGKFIGVHCTHGVNRTGWFVCRYLMERMGMSAREAIVVFNEARGHEMHRPYLTDDLINRCRARAAR